MAICTQIRPEAKRFWRIPPSAVITAVGLVLASPSFADLQPMELIRPPSLSGNCNPCQILAPEGDLDELENFSVSYASRQTEKPNVTMSLGDQQFSLDIALALLENNETFPFFRVEFSNLQWMGMYAIPARAGVRDHYYHYFRRTAGGFSYLGLLPSLFYDDELHAFAAVRLDEPGELEEYYDLMESGFDWTLQAVTWTLHSVAGPVERSAWLTTAPYAGNWKIVILEDGVFLLNREKGTTPFKVEAIGPWHSLEVLEEKKYQGYDLIVYFAGGAGTSLIMEGKYAAIYNREQNKILGAFPLAYYDATYHTKLEQPVWTLGTDKIAIRDVNSNLDVIIDIN